MSGRTRIALVGGGGRMGLEIFRVARPREDVEIVAAVERPGSPLLGRDVGELAGMEPAGVAVTDDLAEAFSGAQVAVDLSAPEATEQVAKTAGEARVPLVCGTTGLTDRARSSLESASKSVPVLYTPNLSLGIAVLRSLVEKAIQGLGREYDIEIVEMHHRHKADAPSGTALALAETAARTAGIDPERGLRLGRAGHTGERSGGEIGVHAVRGGGVFGDHTIVLAGRYEQVEIRHRAISRALFAEGALRVALFLKDKPPGLYQMSDTF